jgi:hypothetical protein
MPNIENSFNLAIGIKKYSDEKIIGIPIPVNGEMTIIGYESLFKADDLYKTHIGLKAYFIKQSSFRFLIEKEADDFLRGIPCQN